MSITWTYVRVTQAELDRAISDPSRVNDLLHEIANNPALPRRVSTEKAWAAARGLLEQAGCPVDIMTGEERFAGTWDGLRMTAGGETVRQHPGPDMRGLPQYVTADRVVIAADWLTSVTFDELIYSIEAKDRPKFAEAIREDYEAVARLFAAAARHRQAMLISSDG
jgi:hypothetical protein